jgi:site-specific DNA-methyltransferase (adenine-specific)
MIDALAEQPYYEEPGIQLWHGDCYELLPALALQADLVLTDPPWGVKTRVDNRRLRPQAMARWSHRRSPNAFLQQRKPIHNDDMAFDPALFLAYPWCIFWGAPCFASRLPDSPGWLVWDKRQGLESCAWPMGEAELAWTNICQGVHVFRNRWMGLLRTTEHDAHYHPTQKPIALMRWCLERAMRARKVRTVLDPFAGAGTTLLAAKELGLACIGIEIDAEYCAITAKRLREHTVLPLAYPRESTTQQELWEERSTP